MRYQLLAVPKGIFGAIGSFFKKKAEQEYKEIRTVVFGVEGESEKIKLVEIRDSVVVVSEVNVENGLKN